MGNECLNNGSVSLWMVLKPNIQYSTCKIAAKRAAPHDQELEGVLVDEFFTILCKIAFDDVHYTKESRESLQVRDVFEGWLMTRPK